jgi:hypothetical protein
MPKGDHHGANDATPSVMQTLNPKMNAACGHGVFPKPEGRVQYW